MKRIVLDAGHADRGDKGSVQYDGDNENVFTMALTRLVKEELERYQCEVVLVHDGKGLTNGDLATELKARGDMVNELKPDFFLSLHHNAGPVAAKGAEIYVWTDKRAPDGGLVWLPAVGNHKAPRSFNLVKQMLPIIRDALASVGISWRGAPDRMMCADFAMLRYPNHPCALLETHFATNPDEDAIMDEPANQRIVAKGIALAIATALQLPEKPAPVDPDAVVVLVDGVELACNARLEGSKTRVDLRPLAEAMNGHIGYDAKMRIVSISTRHGQSGGNSRATSHNIT